MKNQILILISRSILSCKLSIPFPQVAKQDVTVKWNILTVIYQRKKTSIGRRRWSVGSPSDGPCSPTPPLPRDAPAQAKTKPNKPRRHLSKQIRPRARANQSLSMDTTASWRLLPPAASSPPPRRQAALLRRHPAATTTSSSSGKRTTRLLCLLHDTVTSISLESPRSIDQRH